MKIQISKFPLILFNILLAFFTLLIIWIQFVSAFPVPIPHLREPFMLCDMLNLNSWTANQIQPAYFQVTDFILGDRYIEVGYNTPPGAVIFSCKTNIPRNKLFQARLIGLDVSTNSEIEIAVTLTRKGLGGPALKLVKVMPRNIENKKTEHLWEIDNDSTPKSNWLTGDFDQVQFIVKPLTLGKDLTVDIHRIYLR